MSTQNKITPGPWRVDTDPNGKPHFWIKGGGGFVIARVPRGCEGEAKAIAALPELLHACELALQEYESTGCEHDPDTNPDPKHCACCAVQAAIAKAGVL